MQQAWQGNLAQALQQAVAHLQRMELDAASALLARILAATPEQPDALQLMGMIARNRGDPAAAENWLRRSLRANPNQPHVRNNLANLFKTLGRLNEAISEYKAALSLAPGYVDAWINLGLAQAKAGDHEQAVMAYDRALEISPASSKTLNAKGLALSALERLADAEKALREAVRLAPNELAPLNNLANILRERGEEAAAAACFEKALSLAPQANHLRVGLAGACFNVGRFEEAERLLKRALAEEPGNLEAHRTLKTLHSSTGRADEVPAGYEAALQKLPSSRHLWADYVGAMWQLDRFEDGLALIDRAEGACGRHPVFALWRGRMLSSAGDSAGALAHLDLDHDGKEGLAGHQMAVERARCYLRLGEYRRGAEELAPIAFADPLDYVVWAHLEPLWRLSGDARAAWLLDYERFVQGLEIPVPEGFEDHEDFNQALRQILTELHVSTAHPIDQTLRGGTQTYGRLFKRGEAEIRALRTAIEDRIADYVAALPDDPEHPFLRYKGSPIRFSGSWSVRLFDQGFHVSHYHPQGWISSAYYVALPESVADPARPDGRIHFGLPPVEVPDDVGPVKEIQPRIGTLALFPSYCWHGTRPFTAKDPRITVAFDVARD